MMYKKFVFLTAMMVTICTASAQVSIIPQPAAVTLPVNEGSFTINRDTRIIAADKSLQPSIDCLND
jgi:hypothetical protein